MRDPPAPPSLRATRTMHFRGYAAAAPPATGITVGAPRHARRVTEPRRGGPLLPRARNLARPRFRRAYKSRAGRAAARNRSHFFRCTCMRALGGGDDSLACRRPSATRQFHSGKFFQAARFSPSKSRAVCFSPFAHSPARCAVINRLMARGNLPLINVFYVVCCIKTNCDCIKWIFF